MCSIINTGIAYTRILLSTVDVQLYTFFFMSLGSNIITMYLIQRKKGVCILC